MKTENKKQKGMGNKGFSLVELIIVIAIMAILVGILAPQMIRYVERTRVSADVQLADSVRTAIRTAMLDPVVLEDADSNTYIQTLIAATADTDLAALATVSPTNEFIDAVAETLGVNQAGLADIQDNLQSAPVTAGTDMTITFDITDNDVEVTITNSDDGNGAAIVVPRP